MKNEAPDPRQMLKKRFMEAMMKQIKDEAEKLKKEAPGGRELEMDSSEVFRLYSNERRQLREDHPVLKALEKKEQRAEAQRLGRLGIDADRMPGDIPLELSARRAKLIEIPDARILQDSKAFTVKTLDELKAYDLKGDSVTDVTYKRQGMTAPGRPKK
jgi:hypothetical protein